MIYHSKYTWKQSHMQQNNKKKTNLSTHIFYFLSHISLNLIISCSWNSNTALSKFKTSQNVNHHLIFAVILSNFKCHPNSIFLTVKSIHMLE